MNTWYRCPRLYYHKYIQRLSEPSSLPAIKGNIVHTVLQMFYATYENNLLKRSMTLLKKHWVIPKDLDLTEKEIAEAYTDCENLLKLFIAILEMKLNAVMSGGKAENKRHAFYLTRPKFAEMKIKNEKYNLIGIIDAVVEGFDKRITIQDYKTGSIYRDVIGEDVTRQLSFYVLLYYLDTGVYPSSVVANYVRYGVQPTLPVTPSMIENITRDINHFITYTQSDDIKDYPMKENKLCNHPKYQCTFFNMCAGNQCASRDKQLELADVFGVKKEEKKEDKDDK